MHDRLDPFFLFEYVRGVRLEVKLIVPEPVSKLFPKKLQRLPVSRREVINSYDFVSLVKKQVGGNRSDIPAGARHQYFMWHIPIIAPCLASCRVRHAGERCDGFLQDFKLFPVFLHEVEGVPVYALFGNEDSGKYQDGSDEKMRSGVFADQGDRQ